MNDVLKLEELIDVFLLEEFLDEPIIPMINEITRRLENSPIARSKRHWLKTLLNDIKKNRYRVYWILLRLNDVQGDEDMLTNALQQLAREELLSPDQYKNVNELEEINLPAIADIMKETKLVIIIIIMVYKITGRTSLYDSLVCFAVWSNFIVSCFQYSSSLILNVLMVRAFTTSLGRLVQVVATLK